MAQPRDPFYAVKDKVQASLLELRGTISRAEELLKSGAQSAEIEPVLGSARADMSQIHIDVKDLSQTITIVEENRPRFPSIDNRELDSRRGFVTDAKTSLSQYDEHIKKISQKAAQANNQRKQLLSDHSSSRFASSANAEADRGNDDFVQSSRQSALELEKQQDLVMDDMSHALDRLHGIGTTINQQLEESKHALNGLDDDLDEAKLSMDNALRKMEKLLKSSDKGRLCLILVLFILAVGLFFGIVYG